MPRGFGVPLKGSLKGSIGFLKRGLGLRVGGEVPQGLGGLGFRVWGGGLGGLGFRVWGVWGV